MLSLSTHECGMSLYSLSSSLISFINVLWFLSSDYALFLYFSIIMAPLVARQWWSCSAGGAVDTGSIPGSGRSPRGRNGNPLQYSCLDNPMDRGAWQATIHGVARVRHDLATKPPPWERETECMCEHCVCVCVCDFCPSVIHGRLSCNINLGGHTLSMWKN